MAYRVNIIIRYGYNNQIQKGVRVQYRHTSPCHEKDVDEVVKGQYRSSDASVSSWFFQNCKWRGFLSSPSFAL